MKKTIPFAIQADLIWPEGLFKRHRLDLIRQKTKKFIICHKKSRSEENRTHNLTNFRNKV
jgi:hypothetical protein